MSGDVLVAQGKLQDALDDYERGGLTIPKRGQARQIQLRLAA
jgi:predicted negative regulator of RcsB-dependent stress response